MFSSTKPWNGPPSSHRQHRGDALVGQFLVSHEGTDVGGHKGLDAVTEPAGRFAQRNTGPQPGPLSLHGVARLMTVIPRRMRTCWDSLPSTVPSWPDGDGSGRSPGGCL